MDSARFATVMFMFRHQGRVRVTLSEQEVASGGVDRLFDNALAAGAEDFDHVPGADRGVEVERFGCAFTVLLVLCLQGPPLESHASRLYLP